jgi:3-hydroxyacyl-CoA dehydrogenase
VQKARYSVKGNVAVVTLDNPPVNALGIDERRGILESLRRAAADRAVEAIVLIGSDRVFSGGADIRELAQRGAVQKPELPSVVGEVEACPKLVVAAIGRICMGGGLELALVAHYRIIVPDAQVAFPEVKIGLLPGAGGTQRLPRAIGVEKSLDFILSGDPVLARTFMGTPLIDCVADTDLTNAAVAYAKRLVADRAPLRRLRDLDLGNADTRALLDIARHKVSTSAVHYPAYEKIITCVTAASKLPFEAGLGLERKCFLTLRRSSVHRALTYAFMAERACARIPDVPDDTPKRTISSVAIVGAGTMGRGIAMNFLNAGLPVTLLDINQDALDRGAATLRGLYQSSVERKKLTQAKLEERLGFLRTSIDVNALGEADLVIEAVFEDIAVKEQVFRQLDRTAKPGAILATNTSTLDVDRIASFTNRPQDVVGMHFFSPANVMKLLEVVRAARTSKEVLATVVRLARTIEKVAVVAGVCDGFIGNRMLEHYVRMAGLMVEHGALPWQVDQALERWGMAMGPFRMGDLAGNDIGWAIRQRRYIEKPHVRYARIADKIYERGRYGQKAGKGWYAYRQGDRTPIPDPEVEEIITDYRREHGIVPQVFGDEEIVERCIYALINEGARILQEGIALRASDIDVVYLHGYGFPRFRGGPMRYADDVGLAKTVHALRAFERASGDPFWKPAAIIERLVAEGGVLHLDPDAAGPAYCNSSASRDEGMSVAEPRVT